MIQAAMNKSLYECGYNNVRELATETDSAAFDHFNEVWLKQFKIVKPFKYNYHFFVKINLSIHDIYGKRWQTGLEIILIMVPLTYFLMGCL